MSTDYIDFSYPTDIFLNRLKNTVFAPFTSLAISVYHKDDDFFHRHVKRTEPFYEVIRKGEHVMATIKIKGMSCNHCVMAVAKALNELDGIKEVKVDLGKGEATFEETSPVDMKVVREQIKKAGYEVV